MSSSPITSSSSSRWAAAAALASSRFFAFSTAFAHSRTCKQRRLEAQAKDIAKRLLHCKVLDLVSCLLQPLGLQQSAQLKRCSSPRAFTDGPQTSISTSSRNVPLSLCVPRPRWRMPDKLKLQ